MNSTHMTESTVSATNPHYATVKDESMFRATDSSYLPGASFAEKPSDSFQQKKPDFKVITLSADEFR